MKLRIMMFPLPYLYTAVDMRVMGPLTLEETVCLDGVYLDHDYAVDPFDLPPLGYELESCRAWISSVRAGLECRTCAYEPGPCGPCVGAERDADAWSDFYAEISDGLDRSPLTANDRIEPAAMRYFDDLDRDIAQAW